MKIAIIDYGIGNLRSAEKAFQHIGLDAALTIHPRDLDVAEKIVLPGVGNFGECMSALNASGFVGPLMAAVKMGRPLLGICVGLQMLFEGSEECPEQKGLGLIKGFVRRFNGAAFEQNGAERTRLKIPQIGWNGLEFPRPHPLFAGIAAGSHVYFVHSFHAQPVDSTDVIAMADYGGHFCASVGRENVLGVQFHPEKSQRVGLRLLKNFGSL